MIENVRLPSASRYPCRDDHNISAGFLWEMEGRREGGERRNKWRRREWREEERWEGERDLDLSVCHNPIIMFHHFCHILLVTQTNPVIVWEEATQRYECQQMGNMTGYLRGWLPHAIEVKENESSKRIWVSFDNLVLFLICGCNRSKTTLKGCDSVFKKWKQFAISLTVHADSLFHILANSCILIYWW